MVLQFSLVALLPDYGTNKHSNIVENINLVLSELSVGVHKTVNRIGRNSQVHVTLESNTSIIMRFIRSVGYSAISCLVVA